MPVQFTMPPDTRSVGSADPPNDANALIRAINAGGVSFNVLNTAYAGGADPTGVADSTAAFQAAISAAIASTATADGAEVVVPPGTYNLNTGGIQITGPCRIRGLGSGLNVGGSLSGSVTLNCNGSGGTPHLFTFPYQGYLWGGLEIQGFNINYTGSGNVFHLPNITNAVWRDNNITLTAAGSMAVYLTGTVSFLNTMHERCNFTTTAATRSNPMVSLSSVTSGSISNNTFWKCKFENAGLDNTQYMVYIDCAGGSGAYHYMETFKDCWFEHPFGGSVKSLSGMSLTIDCCSTWDLQTGQGQTVGNSTYYIGAYPSTGPGSQQTRIVGCSRNRNGPNGSTTWDIFCESSTVGTVVEAFSVKPDTPSTTTHAYFNFSNHPDVNLIGNMSPNGATVNGNSTTVVSNIGAATNILGAGGAAGGAGLDIVQAAVWQPLDHGYLAWTFDPTLLVGAGTVLGTTGQTVLARIQVRRAMSVGNITVFLNSNGSGLTSGQSFVGLYNSAGTQVATSADQATAWGSGAPKIVTAALSGGPFFLAAGFYWVAFLSNWTTTAPGFGRAQNFSGVIANTGLTAATYRAGTAAGTSTTLPASFTPSSNTASGLVLWAALS